MPARITVRISDSTDRRLPASTFTCRNQTISIPIAAKPDSTMAAPVSATTRDESDGAGWNRSAVAPV